MVIISNANNWDNPTKLKRFDQPNMSTDVTRVAQLAQRAYNRVIPIMVQAPGC